MNLNSIDITKKSWLESNPKKTSLILLLIFVILIEFLLRLFFPPHLVFQGSIVPNELYFKNYLSNNVFITYPSKYDSFKPTINKINSIGIRGPELEKKDKYRVLNIGDSFIQADEVSFENTFGEILNNSNLNIEFISHGIEGWAPTPEFSWIYHNSDKIKYDEVNLFLCVNDFFRKNVYSGDEFYRYYANYSENGIPVSYNITANKHPIKDIVRGLYIYKVLGFAKSKVTHQVSKVTHQEHKYKNVLNEIIMLSNNSEAWDDELKSNVVETLEVIKNIDNFLKSKNIKLNVLFVPLGYPWEDEFKFGKRKLASYGSYDWDDTTIISQKGIELFAKGFLQNHGINYLELLEEFDLFKKENKNVLLFYEMDGHLNKNGHLLVYNILNKHYKSMNDSSKINSYKH